MITLPHRDFPIIDARGIAEQQMEGWMRDLTLMVNSLQATVAALPTFTTGTGSPEGVVEATASSFYIDTTGPTAYQKVGTGNTGWFAV